MRTNLIRTAAAGLMIIAAPAAFAAEDSPSKGGTPVSPSAQPSGAPTGKTGSSDPAAVGTPVAPSRNAQPGTGSDIDPSKGGKTGN